MNDLFIIDFNNLNIVDFKQIFFERFKMLNLDFVSHYLRLKIQRDRVIKIIRLNQKIYLRKVLKNFNMIELKEANNLMNFDFVLEFASNNFKVENFDKIRYLLNKHVMTIIVFLLKYVQR